MDIVINDYSLDGQFESIDDFLDYLANDIISVLRMIDNQGADLLKSYQTYGRNVTADCSLNDLFKAKEVNRYSEISALRRVLVQIIDEPYWETSPKTDQTAVYNVAAIGTFKGDEPNCFSEALERDSLLFSFRHSDYTEKSINIVKNSIEYTVDCITDSLIFSDFLLNRDCITLSELLEAYGKESNILFLKNENSQKYYVDEDINECLSIEDKLQIKGDFWY